MSTARGSASPVDTCSGTVSVRLRGFTATALPFLSLRVPVLCSGRRPPPPALCQAESESPLVQGRRGRRPPHRTGGAWLTAPAMSSAEVTFAIKGVKDSGETSVAHGGQARAHGGQACAHGGQARAHGGQGCAHGNSGVAHGSRLFGVN